MRTHSELTHTHTHTHTHVIHIHGMHIDCTHPQHPKTHTWRRTHTHTHTHTHTQDTHSTCSQLQTITDKHTGLCQFHLHPFQAIKQDTESPNCCVANRFWGKNDTIAGVKRQHTMRPSPRLSQRPPEVRVTLLSGVTAKNEGRKRELSKDVFRDHKEKFNRC